MKRFMLYVFSFCISLVYGRIYAINYKDDGFGREMRPYIYRQFSYQGIKFLERFYEYEYASMIFIAVFGVLFVWSLLYLLQETHPRLYNKELLSIICLSLFCILFGYYVKPYDISTAFFFTLALGFLARGNAVNYLVIFSIACLNKETAVFLIPISLIYFWRSAEGYFQLMFMQVYVFIISQALIRTNFSNAVGQEFIFMPLENIQAHISNLVPSYALFVSTTLVLLWIKINWRPQLTILKISFSVLVTALTLVYFLFGQAFELRVFSEVFSTIVLLSIPQKFKFYED